MPATPESPIDKSPAAEATNLAPVPMRARLSIGAPAALDGGDGRIAGVLSRFFGDGEPSDFGIIQRLYAFALAPFSGAAVASLLLFAWDRFTGEKSFPTQPGHWLLLVQGVGFVASIAVMLLIRIPNDTKEYREVTWFISLRQIFQLTPIMLVALCSLVFIRQKRWRWMFSLMTAGYVLAAGFYAGRLFFGHAELYQVGTSFLWILQTMSIFALIVAVIGDRHDRLPRDFLHTTGIIVRLAVVLLGWALPWFIYFLQR